MNVLRQYGGRLSLVAALTAVGAVAACDTTSGFRPNERPWGFINVGALQATSGEYRTAPTAVFFRGEISSLPNSDVRPDSCFPPQQYVPPVNSFSNVTYLDAGPTVAVTLGAQNTDLPRNSVSGVTTYGLAPGTTVGYQPGDSVRVRVTGVPGGYSAADIRARTAEPFALQPLTPAVNRALQLRWTPATDANSSLVLSLLYTPAGGGANLTREIRCAFRDDGVDSISFTAYSAWADTTNVRRQFLATRLRTVLMGVGDGGLQVISTFQQPIQRP